MIMVETIGVDLAVVEVTLEGLVIATGGEEQWRAEEEAMGEELLP